MKKVVSLIISIIIGIIFCFNVGVAADLSKSEIETYLNVISDRQMNTVKNPTYGSVGGEWTVIGLARYGTITQEYMSIYKSNLKKILDERSGILSATKYTEYARVSIALASIEENPANFSGYNLLKPLAEYDNIVDQGINGAVYALIAFDCGGYDIPSPKEDYSGKKTTRELLKKAILDKQLDDGGWAFSGTRGDTDMTAMTIEALAPYYNKETNVTAAINKGLTFLSNAQKENGGYVSGAIQNCESTAQVLTAISGLGINISDKRFIKNENTILDGLMQYYSDGGFKHVAGGKVNQMATDQAMYALTAYFRNLEDDNGLYEMKDGMTRRDIKETSQSITKKSLEKKNGKKHKKNTSKTSVKAKINKKQNNVTNNPTNNPTMMESETLTAETETTKKNKKPKKKKSDETTISKTDIQSESEIRTTEKSSTTNQDSKKGSNTGILCIVIIVGGFGGVAGYMVYKKMKTENKGKK